MIRRFRFIDGAVREVTNDRAAAVSAGPNLGVYRSDRPLVSQSLGCHRNQVAETREALHKAGLVGVDVRSDGALEITSRGKAGRRGAMKFFGLHDHDGSYGDG